MALAAGMTIGHPCTTCQATMETCDATIRTEGRGCCADCFDGDTHGLLDRFRVVDVAEIDQTVQNLNRLMAQMVIARSEHAKAIRSLRADVAAAVEEAALLRGRVQELEHISEHDYEVVRRTVLVGVMTQVRKVVADLPERVRELEDVARALEAHLKLRRKPKDARPKELGTGVAP